LDIIISAVMLLPHSSIIIFNLFILSKQILLKL